MRAAVAEHNAPLLPQPAALRVVAQLVARLAHQATHERLGKPLSRFAVGARSDPARRPALGHQPRGHAPGRGSARAVGGEDLREKCPKRDDRSEHTLRPGHVVFAQRAFEPRGGQHIREGQFVGLSKLIAERFDLVCDGRMFRMHRHRRPPCLSGFLAPAFSAHGGLRVYLNPQLQLPARGTAIQVLTPFIVTFHTRELTRVRAA